MYDQMWSNINRHITVVWQSVGVLIAAFAVYAAVGQGLISLDIATILLVITTTWLIANVYDASSWYNRNQAIITNIEKLFLYSEDLRNVHPYFAKHRDPGKMLRHLRLQLYLGYGIAAASLLYHIAERILPTFDQTATIDLGKTLPYAMALMGLMFIKHFRQLAEADLLDFSQRAPGVEVEPRSLPA